MAKRVVVTGAAGGVAGLLLPGLAGRYQLRLTDLTASPVGLTGAKFMTGDLTDPAFAAEVTAGADAVIHLAANPDPKATWDELVDPNIRAAATLLDAAAAHDIGKIVIASSAHVMGQYAFARKLFIEPTWPPAPCCAYGATKAFVEALARTHAYQRKCSIICLRLGATTETPPANSALGSWLAPSDLRHLIVQSLETDVRFGIYHGVSANTRQEWQISNAAREIGYEPTEDSEKYAFEVPIDESWGPCVGRRSTV